MQNIEEFTSSNARLKKFRENYGLSLALMGAHFGKGATTYQHWENPGASIPEDARRFLHDLGLSLTWLDTGEGPMLRSGCSIDVVVEEGRKRLRKTFTAQVGEPKAVYGFGNVQTQPATAQGTGYVTTSIRPSMVAQAAQMVDAIISTMLPENRPKDEKRWEAYANVAQWLAQDAAEGKEGRARTFLAGLKVEWSEVQANT